jgi:hypothetical protein
MNEQTCGGMKVSRIFFEDGSKGFKIEQEVGSYNGAPSLITEFYTRTHLSFHYHLEEECLSGLKERS